MFDILSLAENDGDTDKDRALNYALHHNHAGRFNDRQFS